MHSSFHCVNILITILLHITITKIEKYIYQIHKFMHIYLKKKILYTHNLHLALFFFFSSSSMKAYFILFHFSAVSNMCSWDLTKESKVMVSWMLQHLILLGILLSIYIFKHNVQYCIYCAERQMINLLIFLMS